ncbi:MAG TPA: alpha/beta hydrolase domain-containing protein, partial [Kofleriaceae bacterium]
VAGLRGVGLEVPLGTYTGWNLRRAGFAEGEECGLTGSFIPFARTRAERAASGDPRPSLEERYGDHAGYVAAVRAAAARLVAARLLLQADADAVSAQADASSVLR